MADSFYQDVSDWRFYPDDGDDRATRLNGQNGVEWFLEPWAEKDPTYVD